MDRNFNIIEEPVRYRRMHRKAGYSTAAVAVIIAFVVILLLVWWQMTLPPTPDMRVGSDPATLLDQETRTTTPGATTNPNADNQVTSDAEVMAARARAQAELNGIQAQLEAEQDYAAALAAVEELEADLDRTYASATAETRQGWNELRGEFDQLEAQLRDGSADSLTAIAALLETLGQDIRNGSDK